MTRMMISQVRPTSELLGLEHGDAQVEEHHNGQGEQESLGPGHTRSKAQMRPRNAATKPTSPSTARKSAMNPMLAARLSTRCERGGAARQQNVNTRGTPAVRKVSTVMD